MGQQSAVQQRETEVPIDLISAQAMANRRRQIEEMIARRAYERFEERGSVDGHDIDDWVQAELELLHKCRKDLRKSKEAVILHADLPGSFTPDQLDVSVEPRRVTVSGEKELNVTCGGKEPAHTEKRTRRIFLVDDLPVEVDASRATATLKGETLEIVMPKAASAEAQPQAK